MSVLSKKTKDLTTDERFGLYRVLSQSLTQYKKARNGSDSKRSPGGKIALPVLSSDRYIW